MIQSSTLRKTVRYFSQWIILSLIIGVLAGSASALFLILLEWVTQIRESNPVIIWGLPLSGFLIGWIYHHWGKDVVKGNNQILEEHFRPKKIIPLKMAPLVLTGTLLTHLFGGSAGREGTAVQMGSAISDQFSKYFSLFGYERKTILLMGISAGFASVFGTPWAGALFAFEIILFKRHLLKSVFPVFLSAFIADFVCHLWQVQHAHYTVPCIADITAWNLSFSILAGACFGIAAFLFSRSTHIWAHFFKRVIPYPPLRPMLAGLAIAIAVYAMGTTKYIGLGIPVIQESFITQQHLGVFLLKILFTGFTLGAGFKGGEVTPLFFTGAVLGSALSFWVPLPVALLAAMGFVAIFAGATHTPLASTIMGIELFGYETCGFLAVACLIAYLTSGSKGIYTSQKINRPKRYLYLQLKRLKFF